MSESFSNKTRFKTHFSRYYLWYLLGLSLLFSVLTWLFFSASLSPLFPTYSYDSMNRDAEFYLWTGREILEGKKPYLDFYDHKGPLVFYLNALGMAMGGRYGMALLLGISHFITAFFLFLLIYQETKRSLNVCFAFALLLLLYATNGSGNQNGDIVAPLCSLSLYFFFTALPHEIASWRWYLALAIAGLEVVVSLFARPSDAVFGGSICIAFFVCWCTRIKAWRLHLLWGALAAIAGFLCFLALFSGIFASLGVLKPYYHAVFHDSNRYILGMKPVDAIFSRIMICLYLILSTLSFFFARKRFSSSQRLPLVALFTLAITNGVLQFAIAKYPQYWISIFSFLSYQIVHDCNLFWGGKGKRPYFVISLGNIIALVISLSLCVYYPTFYHTSGHLYFSSSSNQRIHDEIESIIPKEALESKDQVYYIDTSAALLLTYDSQNQCPYQTMQSWHAKFKPEVDQAITTYLSTYQPTYVVKEVLKKEGNYQFLSYLNDHYEKVNPSSSEDDSSLIQVYRLVG
ncbi:MAG: hypothetical protein PUC66_04290 [Erysipelotrichaceae bacterium]|nr:hypothetical protein [Erysipelotrichaceae bacterium]